jgi:hypothetical protein
MLGKSIWCDGPTRLAVIMQMMTDCNYTEVLEFWYADRNS